MINARYALSVDVGGTFLKYAVIDSDGRLLDVGVAKEPVDSSGSYRRILSTFKKVIASALNSVEKDGINIEGVAIGFPGPFDYAKGTSQMDHKFQSIKGINLPAELKSQIPRLKEKPIIFAHDAHMFLMGEAWYGAGNGFSNIAGITIGTGIGMGVMQNQAIVDNGSGGPVRSIFRQPCRNATLEDFISKRGILAMYKQSDPAFTEDVKEIAEKARKEQEQSAIDVFKQVGFILGNHLKGILCEFNIECLILGGQISNAFDLFEDTLREELSDIKNLKNITQAEYIDSAPLYGAAKLIFDAVK
ncbi:MAG: ROK family protein [Sedimentisphaerales bacterium]|nr:ROK family protein [Sedimentisphaerales bacterium]